MLVCVSWTKLGAPNALILFSTLLLLFFIPFNTAPVIPASVELLGGGGGVTVMNIINNIKTSKWGLERRA